MTTNEETRAFIHAHRTDDVRHLALQASRYPAVDMNFALTQIGGWQKLRSKVPSWSTVDDLLYPPTLSLEQCSGEEAARYKAELACSLLTDRRRMADFTGGFGVDFVFLARLFRESLYVERHPHLCALARHNFPLLGLPTVRVIEGDARRLSDRERWDLVYLDPARRDVAGNKTVSIADCEPDVSRLLPTLEGRASWVMVKLSPMLDVRRALAELPGIAQLHVVAANGECKELLACVQPGFTGTPVIYCVNGDSRFSFTLDEELNAVPHYDFPQLYLYEPNPALLKAGAYRLLAVRYGLSKLHPNSHLYTSNELRPDFPGRTFLVEAFGGFGKKEVRAMLVGVRQANLTVRNFPATVAELRKQMRLPEGGDYYMFATTGPDGSHLLLRCSRVPRQK